MLIHSQSSTPFPDSHISHSHILHLAYMIPLVSVLLPTLNTRTYLQERLDSIRNQTLQNIEVIIADSYSDDGSWEILQKFAASYPQVILCVQIPRGLYQAWNFCIEKASGKYIYIATSDDSMAPYCLEEMVASLEAHPECDLCDSMIRLIDGDGNEIPEFDRKYIAHHWHTDSPRNVAHIRYAPYDYYYHLGGKTVYTSITQLLIRRTLFKKTGLFPTDFGCSADYLWGLRAALHANVFFCPKKLASWRIHEDQATFSSCAEKINYNFTLMTQMAKLTLKEVPLNLLPSCERTMRLISFKEILLPAKRNKISLFRKIHLLSRVLKKYPLLTIEFLFNISRFCWSIPRKFLLIYSYDKMIVHHAKKSIKENHIPPLKMVGMDLGSTASNNRNTTN